MKVLKNSLNLVFRAQWKLCSDYQSFRMSVSIKNLHLNNFIVEANVYFCCFAVFYELIDGSLEEELCS